MFDHVELSTKEIEDRLREAGVQFDGLIQEGNLTIIWREGGLLDAQFLSLKVQYTLLETYTCSQASYWIENGAAKVGFTDLHVYRMEGVGPG